jgi:hypothetical protein
MFADFAAEREKSHKLEGRDSELPVKKKQRKVEKVTAYELGLVHEEAVLQLYRREKQLEEFPARDGYRDNLSGYLKVL